jgi:hypothetical protein
VLPHGTYSITVSAADSAGNKTSLKTFTLITTAPEATAPEDSGVVTEEAPIETSSTPLIEYSPVLVAIPVVAPAQPAAVFFQPLIRFAVSLGTQVVLGIAAFISAVAPVVAFAGLPGSGTSVSSGGFQLFAWWQRKKYGKVVSSVDGKPINGVLVRLYDHTTNRAVGEHVTDATGSYGFLVKPGTYSLSIVHPDYTLAPQAQGMITVTEEGVVDQLLPVDPIHFPAALLSFREGMSIVFSLIHLPLLILGTLAVVISLITQITLVGVIVGLYYAALWIWEGLRLKLSQRLVTITAPDTTPVAFAIVRLKDRQGTIITTRASSPNGKVLLLAPRGNYTIELIPPADRRLQPTTQPIALHKMVTWMPLTIGLTAIQSVNAVSENTSRFD